MASGGDNTNCSDLVPDADASTDGLTKDEIQAKLQHYADVLNTKDGKSRYLLTANDSIAPIVGSAKVVDGDLVFNSAESSSYAGTTNWRYYEYTLPYHSIIGIKCLYNRETTYSY